MGKAYSLDLRERVARHVAEGGSRREAGRLFGISASTAVRIVSGQVERGTVAPRRQGRPPGRGKLAAHIDFLVELVEAVPDITMPELAQALETGHRVVVHPSSISRALIRHGLTYKKSR
jgi:transposase